MPNQARPRRTSVPPLDPGGFAPSAQRPVRAKVRRLAADTRVDPHSHPWAQVAMSATGVIRMSAGRSTFLVPPSRALWIPPGIEHVVNVVEDAEIRTLYIHPALWPAQQVQAWRGCRVLEVSTLLRECVAQLDTDAGQREPSERERHLSALVIDELLRASRVPLGVELPEDKRLRALCEAVIEQPARWETLDQWARAAGASGRTVARLFRSQLGTSFGQWRQQVLLAHALTLAARKRPMASIAAELGYASPSAFSAMVRRAVGAPPSRFFA